MRILAFLVLFLLVGCTEPDGDGSDGTTTTTGTTTQTTGTDTSRPDGSPGLSEDFEQGIAAWGMERDLPDDPNRGGEVAWNITPTPEEARSGGWSIRFALDGRQDDGTIWVFQDLPMPDQAYDAEVSYWAWSRSESFNVLAHTVAYLGPDAPRAEGDFPAPGQNSATDDLGHGGLREPLDQAEGWMEYTFTWRVPADVDVVHLAIGISAVWETEMSYPVDDVEVMFTPT